MTYLIQLFWSGRFRIPWKFWRNVFDVINIHWLHAGVLPVAKGLVKLAIQTICIFTRIQRYTMKTDSTNTCNAYLKIVTYITILEVPSIWNIWSVRLRKSRKSWICFISCKSIINQYLGSIYRQKMPYNGYKRVNIEFNN